MPYLGRRSTTRGKCRASFCHLAGGQPVMLSCFGCWFWVSCWPLCRTVAGSGRGGGATMRGVPRFKITMAVGHPFIGRGSRPKVGGTPKGCPGRRPLSALRFSQAVELSTVFGSPTTGNFYRKRTTGAPYRFRGGAIYRDGDAGAVASSPRCRHQHDAQRCRYGMTKGIDARMGLDSERGSMRSTKARPRL